MYLKNLKIFLSSLLILVFLAGCVTTSRLPETLVSNDLDNKGLLIGSISRGEGLFSYSFYNFYLRGLNNDVEEVARLSQDSLAWHAKDAFKDDFERGGLFAISLPEGQYEFYNYELYYNNGMFDRTWRAGKDFSMPFSIKDNQITYIGEIKATAVMTEKVLGASWPKGAILSTSDQRSRDISLLKQRYPEFDWKNISFQIVEFPGNSGSQKADGMMRPY